MRSKAMGFRKQITCDEAMQQLDQDSDHDGRQETATRMFRRDAVDRRQLPGCDVSALAGPGREGTVNDI
jgi:hypothetical protein